NEKNNNPIDDSFSIWSKHKGLLLFRRRINCNLMSHISNIIINENNELILTGFHSTYFVVWNMKQDYVLFRWHCGGGKRPYSFQFLNSSNNSLPTQCNGWLFAYTSTHM